MVEPCKPSLKFQDVYKRYVFISVLKFLDQTEAIKLQGINKEMYEKVMPKFMYKVKVFCPNLLLFEDKGFIHQLVYENRTKTEWVQRGKLADDFIIDHCIIIGTPQIFLIGGKK